MSISDLINEILSLKEMGMISQDQAELVAKEFFDKDFEKNDFLGILDEINIFLSYSWKDEDLADKIEQYFKDTNILIKRDKNNIESWGSIREYMDSIRDTDYVILIISDSYLKSVKCMYEINELMKDVNYKDRIFPLVLEKSIYNLEGRIEYIIYWEEKYEEVKNKIKRIKNMENASRVSSDLHFIREIAHSVSEFLDIIQDMNNPDENVLLYSIVNKLSTT